MNIKISVLSLLLTGATCVGAAAADFDQQHRAWDALLKEHVVLIAGGKASLLRYDGMRKDHAQLNAYLDSLSRVSRQEFEGWTSDYRGFDDRGPPVTSLKQFFARYADLLADRPEDRAQIRDGAAEIRFLDYDWRVNDANNR